MSTNLLESLNFLIELFDSNELIKCTDEHHYFLLIMSKIIDIINSQRSNHNNKIKKHKLMAHLKHVNGAKDLYAIKKQIKILPQQFQHANIYEYVDQYYEFLYMTMMSLHDSNIYRTKIDNSLLINFMIKNRINEITFKNKNKNEFVQALIKQCRIPALTANQLYDKIKQTQTSKFILKTNIENRSLFSVGLQFWYSKWRNIFNSNRENIDINSHFENFKDEITDANGKILLSIDIWNIEREKATNNRNKEECRKYCVTSRNAIEFKIPSNTLISIQHLMALQFYCNHRVEQRRFSETYRMGQRNLQNNGNNNEIEYEHKYYANWGRLLYESVNVFGNRQWE
eukprot:471399_1